MEFTDNEYGPALYYSAFYFNQGRFRVLFHNYTNYFLLLGCFSLNTFATQRLVFEGKNEPFLLEKFLLNFSYKNLCVKFDAFQREMVHFFVKKRR